MEKNNSRQNTRLRWRDEKKLLEQFNAGIWSSQGEELLSFSSEGSSWKVLCCGDLGTSTIYWKGQKIKHFIGYVTRDGDYTYGGLCALTTNTDDEYQSISVVATNGFIYTRTDGNWSYSSPTLYRHTINVIDTYNDVTYSFSLQIINDNSTPITSISSLNSAIDSNTNTPAIGYGSTIGNIYSITPYSLGPTSYVKVLSSVDTTGNIKLSSSATITDTVKTL